MPLQLCSPSRRGRRGSRVRGHAREDDAGLAELVRRVHVGACGVAHSAICDEERAG